MKKLLVFSLLVLVVFCSAFSVKAMTETEKQAIIAKIIQQIGLLQAQLDQMIALGVTDTSQLPASTTTTTAGWYHNFSTNLKYGDSGAEVSALQHAMILQGFLSANDPELIGSFFGTNTVAAVIKFQEKYRSEILAPQGLSRGTGSVATGTRTKLNQLYGGSSTSVSTSTINPNCTTNWQCASWSACVNNQQIRSCMDYNYCGTSYLKPSETQYCTATCSPNWQCGSWGQCYGTSQMRTCTDLNSCGITAGKPFETQACNSTVVNSGSNSGNDGIILNPSISNTGGICYTNWQCTDWSSCLNNFMTRVCSDFSYCQSNLDKPKPAESQYCTVTTTGNNIGNNNGNTNLPPPCVTVWNTGNWSDCYNYTQSRTVYDTSHCPLPTSTAPASTQSCTPACSPNWQTGNWSKCYGSSVSRDVTDANNCGITTDMPPASKPCTPPTVTLLVNGSKSSGSGYQGGTVTLSWTSTNTTNCSASWALDTTSGAANVTLNSYYQTYSITCYDIYGTSATDSVYVTGYDEPYISMRAKIAGTYSYVGGDTNLAVDVGKTITLTWSGSQTLGNCRASGDWSQTNIGYAGNTDIGPLTQGKTYNYTITCTDDRLQQGNKTVSATATVVASGPVVDFTVQDQSGTIAPASSIAVPSGTSLELDWKTARVNSCTASGNWNNNVNFPATGSYNIYNLTLSQVYNLSCVDNYTGSIITKTVIVNITKPTVDIKAAKVGGQGVDGQVTILSGSYATLTWASTNATSCTASGDWTGPRNLSNFTTGESTGYLYTAKSYTYTLTCKDANNNTGSDSVTVTVQ